MNEIFTYDKATGQEIERILIKIIPAIEGEKRLHVLMTCLTIAVTLGAPNIGVKELQDGVKGASEWIACYIASLANDVSVN